MQIKYSSRDTIAMTIPNYLQPIIPFHHEYKIRPIRLKLGSLAFLKMHTVTRNNFICNSFSQPATTVRKYIYKAIDRLASMSRSPPKINAESNISQGTHAECKFIPHDSFCLFFHLLTQKNETRSPQYPKCTRQFRVLHHDAFLEHPRLPVPPPTTRFRLIFSKKRRRLPPNPAKYYFHRDHGFVERVMFREIVGRAKMTWRELPAPGHASSFTIGLTTIET